ncbi:hypothetical protein Axy19_004 [Achromobacter phage vB_AxyS_19-32_Axy19]|nr:hypothetical protein Axy19_004 [Achromobacter phage vB_AxyS_19-32_Axy19]
MNISDLRPANQFAQRFGVKMVVYGPPGSGKTPLMATAPNPLLLLIEAGAGSLRNVPSNIPGYKIDNASQADEFFLWWFGSSESKQFDTLCMDSVTHLAELYLKDELPKHKHGMQAYGEMSVRTMKQLESLNDQQYKHLCLIAKMGWQDDAGVQTKTPHFPGKDLNVKVPHLFDNIAYLDRVLIPKHGEQVAMRNKAIIGIRARDRFGKLAELEPPNLAQAFAKSMA